MARASAWDADVDEFVKEAPSYEPMGLPPDEPQKRRFWVGLGVIPWSFRRSRRSLCCAWISNLVKHDSAQASILVNHIID